MGMHSCMRCGAELSSDEVALFRKLVCRGAEEYLCLDCLAQDFGRPRQKFEDMIAYYHRTGVCSLFVKY